jgi:hypothetical protein
MGRKSNVCAHNNSGVPIELSTSVNNAPWCVVRKSVFYPPIKLHGHGGSVAGSYMRADSNGLYGKVIYMRFDGSLLCYYWLGIHHQHVHGAVDILSTMFVIGNVEN